MTDFDPAPDYPPATWRLIIHPPANGAHNMAVDQAISECVAAGDVPPTLRFYAWEPPCLSLGQGQPYADLDPDRLAARGWDVVRRLTGGRAILHADELTYSIAAPLTDPRVTGGVVESYRRLSRGLMQGIEHLGAVVASEKAAEGAHGFKGPVCFEVPSDYEITVDGRKLIGSAQTRREGVVMQHGALPLYGDLTRIVDALVFADNIDREVARARVIERAITLEEALDHRPTFEQVVAALTAGFATALNLSFEAGDLTIEEFIRADILRAERYASPQWTQRH